MKLRVLWGSLALTLLLAGSAQAHTRRGHHSAHAAVPAAAAIGSFGPGGWSWFGDPRAVRVAGRSDQLFVGWIGWHGSIRVGAYDARFGSIRTHVVGQMPADDHSSPAILVEPDKRLTVFWSGHDGPAMYYRTTRRPEDIDAWGPVHRLPVPLGDGLGITYPNPLLLPAEGNTLYLFWRGDDWSADYATRTPDGAWSLPRKLILNPGQRPYLKVDSNGNDTIALAFTDGHPRNVLTSVYYAAYRGGALWHANGSPIASLQDAPISPSQADLIYDARATGIPAWVWDVAPGPGGHPVVLYATFPSPNKHAYWYARWTGSRWVSHFMTFGGPTISPGTIEAQYSAGFALDHRDPSIVYLSRKVAGRFQIERWATRNGGYRWSRTVVVRTPGEGDLRPVVPRGPGGGLVWLRGHYGSYTTYRTRIAFLK